MRPAMDPQCRRSMPPAMTRNAPAMDPQWPATQPRSEYPQDPQRVPIRHPCVAGAETSCGKTNGGGRTFGKTAVSLCFGCQPEDIVSANTLERRLINKATPCLFPFPFPFEEVPQ